MHTKHLRLAADDVVVDLDTEAGGQVEVVNRGGHYELYFTADGSQPTLLGDDCHVVLAERGARTAVRVAENRTRVRVAGFGSHQRPVTVGPPQTIANAETAVTVRALPAE